MNETPQRHCLLPSGPNCEEGPAHVVEFHGLAVLQHAARLESDKAPPVIVSPWIQVGSIHITRNLAASAHALANALASKGFVYVGKQSMQVDKDRPTCTGMGWTLAF